MFTIKNLDPRSKVAALIFSVLISSFTATGFVTGAMVPVSAAQASTTAIVMPLA